MIKTNLKIEFRMAFQEKVLDRRWSNTRYRLQSEVTNQRFLSEARTSLEILSMSVFQWRVEI